MNLEILIPISMCLLQCLCLTICAVILKTVTKRGYCPVYFSLDSFLIAGVFYLALFAYTLTFITYEFDKILTMNLAAGFFILGSTF